MADDLILVTLPAPLPGFSNFLSVWVKTGTPCFMVDVGPSASATALLSILDRLGIKRLDFIFLTHIHLDHAGGTGHICAKFPDTPVICHPAAIQHLADPSRLWEGSLKTLGRTALAYGEMIPTPEHRLVSAENFSHDAINLFITPGHAPHQIAIQSSSYLFAGEACGVHIRMPSGEIYQRPATPPKFFLETTLNSIDLLIEQNPDKICFGHFGMEDDAVFQLETHKKQLHLWKELIEKMMGDEERDDFLHDCMKRLIKEDPFMKCFDSFDKDTRGRETELIRNSIRGYLGYLKNL